MDLFTLFSNPVVQMVLIVAALVLGLSTKHRWERYVPRGPKISHENFYKQVPATPAPRPTAPAAAPAPRPMTNQPIGWSSPVWQLNTPTVQTVKLSTIASSDNVLVVGQKGAGKTTLLRKIIAARATETLIALDPHGAPGKWPCGTVGAGRDYEAIGDALLHIEHDMDDRFKQLARGEVVEGQFLRRSVVTDEYRSIADKLNGKNGAVDAGNLMLNRISEGRKVGECALVACHNDTGEALGITGNTDMKTCFDWIVYMGGLVDSRRTDKCPADVKAAALKLERPAVAWLTEKNQWFVLDDDLAMPLASEPLELLEPLELVRPQGAVLSGSNQFATQYDRTGSAGSPHQDAVRGGSELKSVNSRYELVRELVRAGMSGNKINEVLGGTRNDNLAMVRQAKQELGLGDTV
jgi:hypothetical protein